MPTPVCCDVPSPGPCSLADFRRVARTNKPSGSGPARPMGTKLPPIQEPQLSGRKRPEGPGVVEPSATRPGRSPPFGGPSVAAPPSGRCSSIPGGSLGRTSGRHRPGPQMAAGPGPWGGRGGQAIREAVRRRLVVDPPPPGTPAMPPPRSLHREPDVPQHRHRLVELLEGERDRALGTGIGVHLHPSTLAIRLRAVNPIRRHRPCLGRGGARRQRQVHGCSVQDATRPMSQENHGWGERNSSITG